MEGGLAVVRPKAVAQVRTPATAQVSWPYLPHQNAAGVVPRGEVCPYLPRPACCFSVNPTHDAKGLAMVVPATARRIQPGRPHRQPVQGGLQSILRGAFLDPARSSPRGAV